MNNFCLIGNPVEKSLSPKIHNNSFQYIGIEGTYTTFLVLKEKLKETLDCLKTLEFKGFNVTIPYKEKILEYIDELDESAKLINAVNTVRIVNGKLIGYNTDYLGFKYSLQERKIELSTSKICIIGAGGASKAVAFACASLNPSHITILNRTIEKATNLKNELSKNFNNIEIDVFENDEITDFNEYKLIINTTSVGMEPYINKMPINIKTINSESYFYDIVYKPRKTMLLKYAENKGCNIINGIDMLIYQGLLAEEIWLNQKLPILKIKNYLMRGDIIGNRI